MNFREHPRYILFLMLACLALIYVDNLSTNWFVGKYGVDAEGNPITRWWLSNGLDLSVFMSLKAFVLVFVSISLYLSQYKRLPLLLEFMLLLNLFVVINNLIVIWVRLG